MRLSFSQWSMYNKCPLQYRLYYIDRVVERKTTLALGKGRRIHAELEDYIKGKADNIPDGVHKSWIKCLDDLRKKQVESELEIKKEINGLSIIAIIDIYTGDTIIDFKTGKARPNDMQYRDQLKFYAWALHEPRDFAGEAWWLEHPINRAKLRLKQLPDLTTLDRIWSKRLHPLLEGPYDAKPGWHCKWCDAVQCPHHSENDKPMRY